jgi:hypothetical protein
LIVPFAICLRMRASLRRNRFGTLGLIRPSWTPSFWTL